MSADHPAPDDSIETRLRAYARRLEPECVVADIAIRDVVQPALDASLLALQQALAIATDHDFLGYRLATYFHAREEDFHNPPIRRQTLPSAPLGRKSPRSPEAESGHADI